MRKPLLEQVKATIIDRLTDFLSEEGIKLHLESGAAPEGSDPLVMLESVENIPLSGEHLLSEIRIILGILGKPWQCNALVQGIYQCLHPHHLTAPELTVLLMSLHVENMGQAKRRRLRKQAVMRYIVEEEGA